MPVWEPRVDKQQQLTQGQEASVLPLEVRLHARCLIVLFVQQQAVDFRLSAEEAKIFSGMLSVLELPTQQTMTVIVRAPWPQNTVLNRYLEQWQPKFILQLDMQMPVLNSVNCIQTYSPGYLLINPQHKAAAYKKLLTLRAMLHGTSKRNS